MINVIITIFKRFKYRRYNFVIKDNKAARDIYYPYDAMKCGDCFQINDEDLSQYQKEVKRMSKKSGKTFKISEDHQGYIVTRI